MEKYESLKLDSQLCFPLYAASKEVIKKYRPLLNDLNLTYTQYITLLVLWEEENINVSELGERLLLDSGTLTPVLKSLEEKGYILRKRSEKDERVLFATITERGLNLREKALSIPPKIAKSINLNGEEALTLYKLLYKIINEIA